jgi:flagellar protein FliO/FliZ
MSPGTYFQFAAALAFVVALIAVLAWAVKRSGLFAHVIPARGGKRRLAVVDVAAIDAKRRLVLVRRDDKEHLLLLGANNDAVIETGITPPPQADAAAETAP